MYTFKFFIIQTDTFKNCTSIFNSLYYIMIFDFTQCRPGHGQWATQSEKALNFFLVIYYQGPHKSQL